MDAHGMELVEIGKAFGINPAKPLFSRTTARRVGSLRPGEQTWRVEHTPGAIGRARGYKPRIGGIGEFTTGTNPQAWEMDRGVNSAMRNERQLQRKAAGKPWRKARTPYAPSPQTPIPVSGVPEWLR